MQLTGHDTTIASKWIVATALASDAIDSHSGLQIWPPLVQGPWTIPARVIARGPQREWSNFRNTIYSKVTYQLRSMIEEMHTTDSLLLTRGYPQLSKQLDRYHTSLAQPQINTSMRRSCFITHLFTLSCIQEHALRTSCYQ